MPNRNPNLERRTSRCSVTLLFFLHRIRQSLAWHPIQWIALGTTIGDHHDLNHVGETSHFALGGSLQRRLDMSLHSDADNFRFPRRHTSSVYAIRERNASTSQSSFIGFQDTTRPARPSRPRALHAEGTWPYRGWARRRTGDRHLFEGGYTPYPHTQSSTNLIGYNPYNSTRYRWE